MLWWEGIVYHMTLYDVSTYQNHVIVALVTRVTGHFFCSIRSRNPRDKGHD